VSFLLSGGIVVDPLAGLVETRDLVVEDGRMGGSTKGAQRVDVSGCMVMPGNVCAHHHLYSALARGMPGPPDPPRNFAQILERIWWRLDRALDLETIELSARLGAVEAARSGTTSIVDHHASPEAIESSLDALAVGIEAAGVRAVVCYEVTDRHGTAGGRAGVAENARFLRDNRRTLVRGMMGAHASFTIGNETLDELVSTARDSRAPIHIHVAEDALDEHDSLERYGVRTAHRLVQMGALGEGDLIAHGVHLDDGEVDAVRASGAWVAHNPRSNMNNGVGYAPVAALGERVALGTDGIDGDMFSEARACYLKAREASWKATPSVALDRLSAGAFVVGASFGEPVLGELSPGAPADLMVLDYSAPTPVEAGNVGGHLVFGMGSRAVRDVMVAGRWVVRGRRHQLIDEAELAAKCRAEAPRLWTRMERY
jgi:putative selenium metabolism protein SsnA